MTEMTVVQAGPTSLILPLPTKGYVLNALPDLRNDSKNALYLALVTGQKDDYYHRGYNILKKFIDSLINIVGQIPDLKELQIPSIKVLTFEPLEYVPLEGTTDPLLRKKLLELNDDIRAFNLVCDDHCESCAKAKKTIAKTYFSLSESLSKDTAKFNQLRSDISAEIDRLTHIISQSIRNEELNRDMEHDYPTVHSITDLDTLVKLFVPDKDLKKDPKRYTSAYIKRLMTDLSTEARVLAERMNGKLDKMTTIFEYQSACSKCTKKYNTQKHLLAEIASYKAAKSLSLPAFDRANCTSTDKVQEMVEANDCLAYQHMSNEYVVDYLEEQTHKYLISPISAIQAEPVSTLTIGEFMTEYKFPEDGAEFDDLFSAYSVHDPTCTKYKFSTEIKPFVTITKRKSGKRKYFLK